MFALVDACLSWLACFGLCCCVFSWLVVADIGYMVGVNSVVFCTDLCVWGVLFGCYNLGFVFVVGWIGLDF